MSRTSLDNAREFVAADLAGRRIDDPTIGCVMKWVTVGGEDYLVAVTHEDHLEDEHFIDDDEPTDDPNQLSLFPK